MKIFKTVKLLFLTLLMSSCFNESFTERQLMDNDKSIHIYYYSQPTCNYKVVGHIDVGSFYYTKNALFQYMAQEAEKLKAEAVVIDYLEQLDIKEYVATGKAIICR